MEDGNSRQRHFLFLFLIEAARLLFLSDVFVSVEAPYYGLTGGALIRGRPFIRAWALIQGNTLLVFSTVVTHDFFLQDSET